jgi:hypothetical protein
MVKNSKRISVYDSMDIYIYIYIYIYSKNNACETKQTRSSPADKIGTRDLKNE